LDSLRIYGNLYGIHLNVVDDFRLHDSRVYANEVQCVTASSGDGMIDHNDIADGFPAGIEIYNSSVAVMNNRIHDNSTGLKANYPAYPDGRFDIAGNEVFDNSTGMDIFVNSGRDIVRGNHIHSNGGHGIIGIIEGLQIEDNVISSNTGSGIFSNYADSALISSNTFVGNGAAGVALGASTGDVFTLTDNVFRSNGTGIDLNGARDGLVVGNEISDNVGAGVALHGVARVQFLGNRVFGNGGYGVRLSTPSASAVNSLFLDNDLGYDGAASSPDLPAEVGFGAAPQSLTLRDNRLNPSATFVAGVGSPGASLLRADRVAEPGTLRVWGDHTPSSLAMDATTDLFPSTATTPQRNRWTAYTARITTVTLAAVSQRVALRYDGAASLWRVTGSVSGDLGTFSGAITDQPFPSGTPQFRLTFTPGNAGWDGNVIDFALLARSGDAGVAKRILFGPSDSAYNGGRSSLRVGGGLTLRGTAALPCVIDRFDGASPYYSVQSTGPFTMIYSSVTNTDENGIQLSGAGPVVLTSSSFDWAGVGAGSAGTYLTLRDLTGSATNYGLTFGHSRPAAPLYNVRVAGNDEGLNWLLRRWGGPRAGEDFDDDPNDRVVWDRPPGNPTIAASTTNLRADWTAVNSDGGYVLEVSTSNFPNANADNKTSTVASPAGTTASVAGLDANTAHWVRVGAMWNELAGPVPSYAATVNRWTLAKAVGGAALNGVYLSSATAHWAPLALAPAKDSAAGYRLECSTRSDFGALTSSATTADVALSTLTVSLPVDGSFYFRIVTLNGEGAVNPTFIAGPVAHSVPPGAVADLGALPGEAQARLTWTAPGNNDAVGTAQSYEIRYATFALTEGNFGSGSVWSLGRPVGGASGTAEAEIVTLPVAALYYFALKTRDPAGNLSAISNVVSTLVTGEAPRVTGVAPADGRRDVLVTDPVRVFFNKTISTATWSGVTVRARVTHDGTSVDAPVTGTATFDVDAHALAFLPTAPWAKNVLYEVRVSTACQDLYGNGLSTSTVWTFTTVFDHAVDNVLTWPVGPAWIVPAGSFARDGFIALSSGPSAGGTARDVPPSLHGPTFLNAYDVDMRDVAGQPQQAVRPFDAALAVPTLPAAPSMRPRTLALCRWSAETESWVRLPVSRSDGDAWRVPLAGPGVLGAFALEPASLQDAHPFPVPFRAARGDRVVTFTNLSNPATITIFSRRGARIRELRDETGAGAVEWDTRDETGDPVPSGVYFYVIDGPAGTKRGDLVIVR
jgi:parallel beta-helix repeat protein